MLTVPSLTLLFLCVVVGLGISFVWMLWEVERTHKPQPSKGRLPQPPRNRDRFG